MPLNGDANASQEKVEKLAGPLLEEYLHIKVTNKYLQMKVTRQTNIHQTRIDGNLCDFMNLSFRILMPQSKRSQRSLQRIQLHGELSVKCKSVKTMMDLLQGLSRLC